jgi:hypothetical protein
MNWNIAIRPRGRESGNVLQQLFTGAANRKNKPREIQRDSKLIVVT